MASGVIDSAILKDLYGSEEMRQIFSDENLLQCWLNVEAALARAEAAAGIVPKEAAEEITRKAQVKLMDIPGVKRGLEETGHPIVPVVSQLAALCDGEAGRYVHWGATTQDITDTGLVLQLKAAYAVILRDLKALAETLTDLAVKERDTLMPGRTHAQHAMPITFGYKVAVWLAVVQRHITRMEEYGPRILVGQFGGAVGTLASIGAKGIEVLRNLMAELGLGVPEISWHVARDRMAEWVSLMAMISSTTGQIAQEVILLQKTEASELEEPFHMGKVGSSTMPHKRNPMLCEAVAAQARLVRALVPTAMAAMLSEHERDWPAVLTEWSCVTEATIRTGGALDRLLNIVRGLKVNQKRMLENVDMLHGMMLSEAVMLRLGAKVGRLEAHHLVYQAAMQAFETGRPFRDLLLKDPVISQHLTAAELDEILQPEKYTGLSGEFVDMVAGGAKA